MAFGLGRRAVRDKGRRFWPYRYTLAIENSSTRTIDGEDRRRILAGCLPFYYGPPNIADYLPADSLVPVSNIAMSIGRSR